MKAIFHIDDPARWPLALGNAENLLAYCRERGMECVIELLANGPAVAAYQPAGELAQRMAALAAQPHTEFTACANALRAAGLSPAQLPPFVTVVPAGVAELAERQAAGYAYIKP